MMDLDVLVDTLCSPDTKTAYQALLELKAESAASPAVYSCFDRLAQMMDDPNSYVRTRGLLLMCANARWDKAGKLNTLSEHFLSHITDPKPITARQFIRALPEVAKAKPELSETIRAALENADLTAYPDTMVPLVLKDITAVLKQF